VTDDPKYKDYDPDSPGLEGAMVEYCRLDSRQQGSIPTVFEPSTVVSARSINKEQKVSGSDMRLYSFLSSSCIAKQTNVRN
jgi:hypothetical protein